MTQQNREWHGNCHSIAATRLLARPHAIEYLLGEGSSDNLLSLLNRTKCTLTRLIKTRDILNSKLILILLILLIDKMLISYDHLTPNNCYGKLSSSQTQAGGDRFLLKQVKT